MNYEVVKSYRNRKTDELVIVEGVFKTGESLALIQQQMNKREISSLDIRIEWEEFFDDDENWEYEDYSFQLKDNQEEITLTRADLVEISEQMHSLHNGENQGYFEWLLFKAIKDVKGVNLFAEEC